MAFSELRLYTTKACVAPAMNGGEARDGGGQFRAARLLGQSSPFWLDWPSQSLWLKSASALESLLYAIGKFCIGQWGRHSAHWKKARNYKSIVNSYSFQGHRWEFLVRGCKIYPYPLNQWVKNLSIRIIFLKKPLVQYDCHSPNMGIVAPTLTMSLLYEQ